MGGLAAPRAVLLIAALLAAMPKTSSALKNEFCKFCSEIMS